ncbi:MAG: HDOD domain-containing protein [Planctomycetes bacterium]|nr:HDOD domain-containing protein [Planctomycetota bacterium]
MSPSSPFAVPPKESEIDRLISRAVELHTLPAAVLEARRIMDDPRKNAQDVANLIAGDPAFSARVLRMANSAYYGFRRRIGTLSQAIVVLGFQAVRNLLLTAGVIEVFKSSKATYDHARFWTHSVATAIAAQEIATRAAMPQAQHAYVAGLMHDVGKAIIAQHMPEHARSIRELELAGAGTCEAEREIIGHDHADIGGRLVTAWGLPAPIADAIREHHQPQKSASGASDADVIHLADIVAKILLAERAACPLSLPVDGLSSRLGYDEKSLAEWVGAIAASLERAADFFQILGIWAATPAER